MLARSHALGHPGSVPLGRGKPLVVLAAGRIAHDAAFGDELAERHLAKMQAAQKPLLALSTNSSYLIAERSTHDIPREDPELVERAVVAVVMAARDGARLTLPE